MMNGSIEESVAAVREYRADRQKAKNMLVRAGIAQVNPTTGELELVPELRPKA